MGHSRSVSILWGDILTETDVMPVVCGHSMPEGRPARQLPGQLGAQMLLLRCTLQMVSATHDISTGHLWGQLSMLCCDIRCVKRERGWGMTDEHLSQVPLLRSAAASRSSPHREA